MIPGICNVCGMAPIGKEARNHIARCVGARYGVRVTSAALKGRRRAVHISGVWNARTGWNSAFSPTQPCMS